MASFIKFTDEQKQAANAVDLECFLICRGEQLLESGREKRLTSNHSVTVRGNTWYDHATRQGGKAISFLQYHYGMNFPEAVQTLLDSNVAPWIAPEAEMPRVFSPPMRNENMRRVFAYLIKERKIDGEIVAAFARQKLIYEDAQYHNVVFAGLDENGMMLHAHKRSTGGRPFRQNVAGSDPRYSFHYVGLDGLLFVFEAPIDLLSYITLHPENWEQHSYVACCGTSAIPVKWMLERKPFTQVLLCYDNDKAGLAACQQMEKLLPEYGVETKRLMPRNKDWNDDLKDQVGQQ
ncbi:MAG: DUF3991 and TOPRIM domain-containing protein [Oscillospiraceae bacterium]|nr:DUF3991 and TOPRIM domain-containing protein [Oscillospiraceae bacterium]